MVDISLHEMFQLMIIFCLRAIYDRLAHKNQAEITEIEKKSQKQQICSQFAYILGIRTIDLANLSIVKVAFRTKTLKDSNSSNRKKRIALNKIYSQVCADIHKSKVTELQEIIIEGDIQSLKIKLKEDKKLLNSKINEYPLIYLAVRCGHEDVVNFLLRAGCSLNFKNDRSTPMHCAAFYGYSFIISLLATYGVPTDVNNIYKRRPQEDASSDNIRFLFKSLERQKKLNLHYKLLKEDITSAIINIKDPNSDGIVIQKILHKNYYEYWNHPQYDDAYHGTHFNKLYSIMKHGLKKPGDIVDGEVVKVVKGHFPLENQIKKNDWARAVFVSPSVYYSANYIYAQGFTDVNYKEWLPILQVKVKKGTYSQNKHTLKTYDLKANEPVDVQYRIALDLENSQNATSSKDDSIVVIAILFIKKQFLQSNIDYQETSQLILNSQEEKNFRFYNCQE